MKSLISSIASASRTRIALKERASSASSSLDSMAIGWSSCISLTCRVASAISLRIGLSTNRRVKNDDEDADQDDVEGR